MLAAFLRLLALAALVLMPLGMAGAVAQPAALTASAGHCADKHQQPADAPREQSAHCAACVALPAPAAPTALSALPLAAPVAAAVLVRGAALEPEIATPPPKRI